MNIYLCSIFRNAASYLDRYVEQAAGLDRKLTEYGGWLRLVLGYGDSNDHTGELLYEALCNRIDATLIDVSHNGPVYGPVVDARRFRQLAYCGNRVLDQIPADADMVLWAESDLIWHPEVLYEMIIRTSWRLQPTVLAPMVLEATSPRRFYDTWAFRYQGKMFEKEYPFHPELADVWAKGLPVEMDSVGSCVAMPASLARTRRFPEEDVFVGFCNQVRQEKGQVLLDPALAVAHP